MTNIDTRTSGGIALSYDPVNIFLYNIDVDYSKNNCGFYFYLYCNYPEAYTNATANATNIKFYYSTGYQLASTLVNPPLVIILSGNVYLNGIYYAIYSTLTNLRTSLGFTVISTCIVTRNETINIDLQNM